jgi:hypothetical protein
VAVRFVDGLIQASADGGGVAGENVLAGDFALLDLVDASFGHAHALGDLLLGQSPGAADLGEPVPAPCTT